MTQYNAKLK